MKSHAILVNEWARPNYLYVCLQGLKQCTNLRKWDLFVFLDGAQADFGFCEKVIPAAQFVKSPNRLGKFNYRTHSLKQVFDQGYEHVFFLEGDMLLRRDALDYAMSTRTDAVFLSTYCTGVHQDVCYISTGGNLIKRHDFDELYEWMTAKKYLGLPNVLANGEPITEDCADHDLAYYAWCIQNNKINEYADEHLALHFGFVGMNHSFAIEEKEVFDGFDRSEWLDNLLRVYKRRRIAGIAGAFKPTNFDYA